MPIGASGTMGAVSDLTSRYGAPRSHRRATIVAIVVLAAVFLTWVGWVAWTRSHPAVVGQIQSFDVTSDREVSVTFRIDRRDPAQPVTCRVFAQAVTYDRVAELDVDVPAGTGRLTDTTVTLRTLKRATSASIEHCRVTP